MEGSSGDELFNSRRLHVCLLTRGFDLTKSSRMLI